jgi:hypothetical protein
VVDSAPAKPAADEKPTAETMAWAGQMVTDALAAETAATANGKNASADVNAVIGKDFDAYFARGVSKGQAIDGLKLAIVDPRNTPLTKQAFTDFLSMVLAGPATSGGGTIEHCTGCK